MLSIHPLQSTSDLVYRPGTRQPVALTAPDGGILAYSYDGALVTSAVWTDEISGSLSYVNNNSFQVSREEVNNAHAVLYSYDRDGLVTAAGPLSLIRDAGSGLVVSTEFDLVRTEHSYNAFGETAAFTATYSGADLIELAYSRDGLGRITEKAETIAGVSETYRYLYDPAGRLGRVERNGATVSEYAYDSNGNRLSYSSAAGNKTGLYDDQDRLIEYGDTTYTYTANGDLSSKSANGQTVEYDYDSLGNLLSVELLDGLRIEYLVDARNRRIGKKVNGAVVQGLLYRESLQPAAELDGTGAVVARFVYASRRNSPDYVVKGGITYRVITDHLGSPRLIVDTVSGAIAQRLDYDEFGRVVFDTNPGFQPFGFAGGLYDPQTGLVRFGARDYDPEVGRWTIKDPILFRGGSSNLYQYALSDPVNLVDPSGLADRPWPFNGRVINDSSEAVISVDMDHREVVLIEPGESTSRTQDVDFVLVDGKWYKIGPWNFDVNEDGEPDDGFQEATEAEVKEIEDILKEFLEDLFEKIKCRRR